MIMSEKVSTIEGAKKAKRDFALYLAKEIHRFETMTDLRIDQLTIIRDHRKMGDPEVTDVIGVEFEAKI